MQIKIVSKIKNGSNGNGNGNDKVKKDDMKPKKIRLPELEEIEN
jgi:hypothetical protein